MQTPLNASASSAGALLSTNKFEVPQFQREYAWGSDEVEEFWQDLKGSLYADSYFLGLIILTEGEDSMHVVDGQQRLLTLTLLANALYHEARRHGRKSLADRIQADFLRSIDYDTDETDPRMHLTDHDDNATLDRILKEGLVVTSAKDRDSVSQRLIQSNQYIFKSLKSDLSQDPFKRLGVWTDFITNRLYFAVFVHPDPASAYQVFEVINTRGKDLTTAHLLKNYILSQTKRSSRQSLYEQWSAIASEFSDEGSNNFVQYIRHAITVRYGHVLPRDLFSFLSARKAFSSRDPVPAASLMDILESYKSLYLQMIDPTLGGPADGEMLDIFKSLNALGVIAVRPILLAMFGLPDGLNGMRFILRLVVRRIVVGNLGTGNVERRFGESARQVFETQDWNIIREDLRDLNPTRQDFVNQLKKRSLNKGVLTFMRRSIIERRTTPEDLGTLHFIWTRQTPEIGEISDEDGSYWASTLGNTILSRSDRRPRDVDDWEEFRDAILPTVVDGEATEFFEALDEWSAAAIEEIGSDFAEVGGEVWY